MQSSPGQLMRKQKTYTNSRIPIVGVMASVSKAFYETPDRRGLVIGILPSQEDSMLPKPGYPNRWVEIPVYTHLPLSGAHGTEMLSRNHINILSSDVIVALPGGSGTASELALALKYQRPVIAFLKSEDEIPGLSMQVMVRDNFNDLCQFIESCLLKFGTGSYSG
jgi:uncharacterized protein (TIGR00725 family)